MIVVDTSAWIELMRATGSAAHLRLRRGLERREEIAVTEVIAAEVLAGARSRRQLGEFREMLLAFPVLSLGGLAGFEHAAELYRACRAAGESLRSLVDCLVAVPAIEAGAPLLHADRDFVVLARHTPLELVDVHG